MVIKGDVTTGAIVSSVIVSGRISGIISNFSSTLISILSAEKTGKDLLSFLMKIRQKKHRHYSPYQSAMAISLFGV